MGTLGTCCAWQMDVFHRRRLSSWSLHSLLSLQQEISEALTFRCVMLTAIIITVLLSAKALAVSLPDSCGHPAIQPSAGGGQARIVGGQAAVPYSWPWQTQMVYKDAHHCGGSLITQDWVVTAAHCIFGYTLDKMKLRAGRYSKNNEPEASEQVAYVKGAYLHPDYQWKTYENDIALIHLDRKMTWTDQVSPVCLTKAGPQDPVAGTRMSVTGWGDTWGTCCADVLKEAVVPIIDRETCNSEDFHDGWITPHMICAGYPAGGTDSCQGDSGGPLVNNTQRGWELVGIVSWGGQVCADASKPGVYTKLAIYLSWIHDVIDSVEAQGRTDNKVKAIRHYRAVPTY